MRRKAASAADGWDRGSDGEPGRDKLNLEDAMRRRAAEDHRHSARSGRLELRVEDLVDGLHKDILWKAKLQSRLRTGGQRAVRSERKAHAVRVAEASDP